MRAALEANIVRSILARVKGVPGLVVRKLHGNGMAVAGDPDLYGCYRGRGFSIEVKRPGEKPTPLQQARLAEWGLSGAITGCAHDADEFCELLGLGKDE